MSSSDGRGGLVVRCPACERFERGICRYCPLPVNGAVRKARFCETHREQRTRASLTRYKVENRKKICQRTKARYRGSKAVRQQRNDYKRLWRKANPQKVKAQKRREALRQNPRVLEYQRQYRASHGISGHHKTVEGRTCLGCPTPVSGRTKKCASCKERERLAAINLLAPTAGRGKRTDLRASA